MRLGSGEQITACRRASLVTPRGKLARFTKCALGEPATAGSRDADARRSAGTSGAQSTRIGSSRLESGLVTAPIPRLAADKLGTSPFRSDCASQNFSIIVTKKRSTRFCEIQGPVCVDGLVLRHGSSRFGNDGRSGHPFRFPATNWLNEPEWNSMRCRRY